MQRHKAPKRKPTAVARSIAMYAANATPPTLRRQRNAANATPPTLRRQRYAANATHREQSGHRHRSAASRGWRGQKHRSAAIAE
jgi:hypothetical protein